MYRGLAGVLVILFLASVARSYHPGTGFTSLISLPEAGHEYEVPALHALPHAHQRTGYDGQFYAQFALDPLVRDPATDRAMDIAPYRARRILFSWTAYALGLGRPSWIVQAYALQNVVCWLILAVVLTRWLPVSTARGLAAWTACLFAHGMLWSVRFALVDGPSLLLIALAVVAIEKGRPLAGAALVGLSGLGRETNILAGLSQPLPRDRRGWLRLIVAGILIVAPLLIWMDYLYSIYRSTTFAQSDQLSLGTGIYAAWRRMLRGIEVRGPFNMHGVWLALLASLAVQVVLLVVRRRYDSPWWRVAVAYAALMFVLDRIIADPQTGAITRVLLPMTAGFNILLVTDNQQDRFWFWWVAGNLHLLAAARLL
jgi:hypothetical protein